MLKECQVTPAQLSTVMRPRTSIHACAVVYTYSLALWRQDKDNLGYIDTSRLIQVIYMVRPSEKLKTRYQQDGSEVNSFTVTCRGSWIPETEAGVTGHCESALPHGR